MDKIKNTKNEKYNHKKYRWKIEKWKNRKMKNREIKYLAKNRKNTFNSINNEKDIKKAM